eukprot:jgi/Ulvmu1/8039/UM004_0276.1
MNALTTFLAVHFLLVAVRASTQWLASSAYSSPKCTIDRVPIEALSKAEFVEYYEEQFPVILQGTSQLRLASLTEKEALLKYHGDTVVTLSSSNTFSYGRKSMALQHYLNSMSGSFDKRANESFYLFGPHAALSPKLSSLIDTYEPPPFSGDDLAYSFGIGGPGTGIPFHIHGHGYSEVIHGGKRWLLFPPEHKPPFDPDEPVASWLEHVYPKLPRPEAEVMEECNIWPGEVLYFPSNWWHAVINLGETVFVSSFESNNRAAAPVGFESKLGL